MENIVFIQGAMLINHVLHVHVYIVPTMLAELLYPFQYDGDTPLHLAAKGGHTTCVEHLLSTPGIDVNIKTGVSWYTEYESKICTDTGTVADLASHYTTALECP